MTHSYCIAAWLAFSAWITVLGSSALAQQTITPPEQIPCNVLRITEVHVGPSSSRSGFSRQLLVKARDTETDQVYTFRTGEPDYSNAAFTYSYPEYYPMLNAWQGLAATAQATQLPVWISASEGLHSANVSCPENLNWEQEDDFAYLRGINLLTPGARSDN